MLNNYIVTHLSAWGWSIAAVFVAGCCKPGKLERDLELPKDGGRGGTAESRFIYFRFAFLDFFLGL